MSSGREASNLITFSTHSARSEQSILTSSVLDSPATNTWSSLPHVTQLSVPVLTEELGSMKSALENLSATLVSSLGESVRTLEPDYSSISPTATTSNLFSDNWTSANTATATTSNLFSDNWTSANSASVTSSLISPSAALWTQDLVTTTRTWPSNSATFGLTILTTSASSSETFQLSSSLSVGASYDISSLNTSYSSDPFQYSIDSTIDSRSELTSSVQFLDTSTANVATTNNPSTVMLTSTSYVTEGTSTISVTEATSMYPITEVTSTFDTLKDEKDQLYRKIEDLNGTVQNLTIALAVVAVILFLIVAIFVLYKTCRYWRSRHTPTALPLDGLDNKPLKRDQKSYFRPQSTYDLTDKEDVRYQSSYSNSSCSDKQDELVTFPKSGRVTSGPVGGWERGSTNMPLKDESGHPNAGFDLGKSPGHTKMTSGHGNSCKGGDSSFVDIQLT